MAVNTMFNSYQSISPLYFFFFLIILLPPRSTLFPTRRSSDLDVAQICNLLYRRIAFGSASGCFEGRGVSVGLQIENLRSEEHTSELQSRLHLVCRLLLEKKKNKH